MKQMISIKYNDKGIPAYFSYPDTKLKYPGIILIHEIWGLNDNMKDISNKLTENGYAVLAPDLFEDTPIKPLLTPQLEKDMFDPESRDKIQPKLRELFAPLSSPEFGQNMMEKLRLCFMFLEKDVHINSKIAVGGFCFGGTYSFALSIDQPKIKAAVVFYGQSPTPLESVEKIKCPVLALYGQEDERLVEQLPRLKEAMKNYNKKFDIVVYPNSGHAFFNETNPYRYKKDVSRDAWAKMLSFLKENLS